MTCCCVTAAVTPWFVEEYTTDGVIAASIDGDAACACGAAILPSIIKTVKKKVVILFTFNTFLVS